MKTSIDTSRRKMEMGIAAVLLAGCLMLPAVGIHADKIVYKNNREIEGIIQEEYPTRVKFLQGGARDRHSPGKDFSGCL